MNEETQNMIRELKKLKRWLNGRGRKYVNDDVDIKAVSSVINETIRYMSNRMSRYDFMMMFGMACDYAKKNEIVDTQRLALANGRKIVNSIRRSMKNDECKK